MDTLNIKQIFFSLINQLLRSSTSIGANLVEAKSPHSKKILLNFMKFLSNLPMKLKDIKASIIKEKYIPYCTGDFNNVILSINDQYTSFDE